MASIVPNSALNFTQNGDGLNLFKPISRSRISAVKCTSGSIVRAYDCKGTSYNPGISFQGPLRWVSIENPILVSSHDYVFASDHDTCEHCGKTAKCILFGPPNGQQHWLCPECAKRKKEMIRAKYFLARSSDDT